MVGNSQNPHNKPPEDNNTQEVSGKKGAKEIWTREANLISQRILLKLLIKKKDIALNNVRSILNCLKMDLRSDVMKKGKKSKCMEKIREDILKLKLTDICEAIKETKGEKKVARKQLR